uniref:Dynein light chain n=1 Tax=Schistosoma japonicum TaxID=6182 RepID=C1LF41_SCHJA|nr:Dynein light chain 1, cytoplasmic [Schistosoma japonicum]
MQGTNCLLKNSDMSEEMKQKVIDLCTRGVEKFTLERDIACYIKKECDHHFKPTWHCIVGKNFGSFITHDEGSFIYLFINKFIILLFKSG